MNRKNISRVITKKFHDWISTIEDEQVKNLVQENTVITGGALASLVMNEKPHDFDVYFTDKATVLAVARYYIKQFLESPTILDKHLSKKEGLTNDELTASKALDIELVEEGDRIRIRLPSAGIVGEESDPRKYAYFESRPEEDGDDYVTSALGEDEEVIAMMNDLVTDADDIAESNLDQNGQELKHYRPIYLSDNAITLSDKIQLVIRFYGQPKEIHSNFDYIHCTNYWTSKNRRVTLTLPAIESIITKELRYVGSKYPVCSIIRLRKFLRKGWHINAGQILKILLQISQLNLLDPSVLQEQLVGVDTAYFQDMINKIKRKQETEGEDFKLDMTYLVSIIDKIF